MKIYHYHPEYKYLIYDDVAEQSPLDEPGVYLIPAHATSTEPPKFSKGFIPIFSNDLWEIVEDKRGLYYNISTGEESYNDNPLQTPENTTTEKPPEVLEGKKLKWNNEWILEDISNELPTQPKIIDQNLTPQEKLERIGLSIDDLKSLLGLSSQTP
jgi:hypothetical protein